MLVDEDAHQRETITKWPIRLALTVSVFVDTRWVCILCKMGVAGWLICRVGENIVGWLLGGGYNNCEVGKIAGWIKNMQCGYKNWGVWDGYKICGVWDVWKLLDEWKFCNFYNKFAPTILGLIQDIWRLKK